MKECINCGYHTDSAHCPQCGQTMEIERVTFKGILNEFISNWLGFDTKFGRTIVDMVKKPGEVVNGYLEGNRTKHIAPLGFLVIMTALLVISLDVFGLEAEDFISETQSNLNGAIGQEMNDNQAALQQKINDFASKNFRFFSAILIPFWAIAIGFVYRKAKRNYVERLVTIIYMTSQGFWLNITMIGIFAFTGYLPNLPITIISLLYYSYCFKHIFDDKNYLISLLKTMLSTLLSIIIFMITIVFVSLVIGVVMVIKNPELLQQQG